MIKQIPDSVMGEFEADLRKPVDISFHKEEGLSVDPEIVIKGALPGVFAGLCGLIVAGLVAMHPGDKKMQKTVLGLMIKSTEEDLELDQAGTMKHYGPISPDDVDF